MENYFILISGTPEIESYIRTVGYAGIIIWFLTFDQLTLLPEEISLITIGYLCSRGIFNPILAGFLSIIPLIMIDIAYYFLSRSGSKFLKKYSKKSDGKFIGKYKEKLKRNMGKTIFTLCFIPRMRYWCPILIGSMNLSLKKFVLFDAISLSVFIAIYISLGMLFHRSLQSLLNKVESLQNIIFFSSVAVFAALLTVLIIRRRKRESV